MVDIKIAVAGARSYLDTVFATDSIRNVRLEEVILSDDDRFLLITFGFTRSEPGLGVFDQRVYKTVKVDARSGSIRGVQIREVA